MGLSVILMNVSSQPLKPDVVGGSAYSPTILGLAVAAASIFRDESPNGNWGIVPTDEEIEFEWAYTPETSKLLITRIAEFKIYKEG